MKNKMVFNPSTIASISAGSLSDPFTLGLSVKASQNGKTAWKYMRWIPAKRLFFRKTLGFFPQMSIAAAREAAGIINKQIEAGVDPRMVEKERALRERMTVDLAHALYMKVAT